MGTQDIKAYELPKLPYAYNALEPVIDEATVKLHHDKHHAGYVTGLNKAIADLETARKSGDFAGVKGITRNLAFHGSGTILHNLYWESMCPGGRAPAKGSLMGAIERDFGTMEGLQKQFLAATKDVEGSGWGVLGVEPTSGRLLVLQAEKHQNLTVWGVQPIMVCDVWEHAYYLQYQNRRADYVDKWWTIIDWAAVEERFKKTV